MGRAPRTELLPSARLRSGGFDHKRDVYPARPYVVTAEVAEVSERNPDAIQTTQKWLAELTVLAWPMAQNWEGTPWRSPTPAVGDPAGLLSRTHAS
jgi:hypothetical protein